jgi:hypothetical protein
MQQRRSSESPTGAARSSVGGKGEFMKISRGASEICAEARWPGRDREKLKALIDEHGIDAAAEALERLGQIVGQTGNVSHIPRQRKG